MIRKGVSGGLLSIVSLLDIGDRHFLGENSMIKLSSRMKKEAEKIGLQSLYANAEEVLKKYKDFDIIKAMKAHKDSNLLWVRARAIDANVVNSNGDYFSEEELTKEIKYKGKKIPAYKTFEGVPIFTNHKNDNVEEAKGMVVYAEWDDEEKCVYCVFFIDVDSYPDIARGIQHGYIHDVSMGCSVDLGRCSICGNEATTEKDYCFAPGTLITLSDGSLKPIESITIGDKVITHSGQAKQVRRLSVNNIKDNVLKISSNGTYLPLVVTQNHPFLSVPKESLICKRDKRQICKPGQLGICFCNQRLQNGNQTCFTNDQNLEPSFSHSGCLNVGDYIQSVTPKFSTNHLDLTYELAKFAGYYMAEGCLHKISNSVILSFHADEKEIIEDLESICQNLPENLKSKFKFRHEIREGTKSLSWRWANKNLKTWISQNCIGQAIEKKISEELFQDLCSNKDLAYAFLSGFIDGDGHQGEKNIKIQIRTASKNLTNQIVQILATLGIKASTFLQAQQGGPTNREKICYIWHVNINGYDAHSFIGKTFKVLNTCSRENTRYVNTKYGFASPIYDIEKFYYEGPVYNFSVEDDESYIANGIAVHNCECLKRYKGKNHPSGKKAFEYNYGIKFIELSCVGDGAFELCEIEEIYDHEELLEKAQKTVKSAQALNSSITLAASIHDTVIDRKDVENFLRKLNNYNATTIKIAQTAGTLVGGQLMAGGTSQNATVVKILQGLGIDASSSLNILDLVNLSLNFLEVAVLNLFSRKDNIDLTHVAKLTKAMGELQDTLQDMIDDGVETGQQRNTQPMIPQGGQQVPQMGAQQPMPPSQPQQATQAPPMQTQQSNFQQPTVGTMISPFDQQPMALPLGGGVTAQEKNNTRFVWASDKNDSEIEINESKPKINKIGKFILALDNLREACEIPIKNNNEEILPKPQKDKFTTSSSGDKTIMDHFKKIAQDIKKANTVAITMDIKLDDQSGNRIVLSTDQGIKGFHKNKLTNWSPDLNETQLHQMENGDGYKVAADLLKDFSKIIKTAEEDNKIDCLLVQNDYLEKGRTDKLVYTPDKLPGFYNGDPYETYQQKLESRRTGDDYEEVLNDKLDPLRTKKLIRITTDLYDDVKRGKYGEETLEQLLHPNFGRSVLPGKEVMSNVMKGIVKTCKKTNSKPENVINFLTSIPKNDLGNLICIAKLGSSVREYNSIMNKFSQKEDLESNNDYEKDVTIKTDDLDDYEPEMETESFKDIADSSLPETSEGDILKALEIIKENFEQAVEKLDEILNKDNTDVEKTDDEDMKDAFSDDDDLDQEALKGAVTGLSLSGEETGAKPSKIVDTINEMPIDDVVKDVEEARLPSKALARVKNKSIKTASKENLKSNIIGWLADIANHNKIPTNKISLATKLFCSYGDAATKVLSKSIKTSEIKVIDETTHSTIINATLEDIGCDIKDATFNEKFRDFAVQLLSKSGYEVDPTTFALTEITVDENGLVCGRVSTRATKTFIPDDEPVDNFDLSGDYHDPDRSEKMITSPSQAGDIPVEVVTSEPATMPDSSIVMSDSSKTAKRLARIKNVIKVAQSLGLPGSPTTGGQPGGQGMMGGGPGAAPGLDPLTGTGMAGGAGDLGFGALTGTMGTEGGIDESPEPGNKSPWGTICPQCGSKDVDIANGEGKCNSCNAQLKYKFMVEVSPPDEGNPENNTMAPDTTNPAAAPLPPTGGPLGAPEAGVGGVPPAAPGSPAMASDKNMKRMAATRISYTTSADVYVSANSEGFNKDLALKLPIGMICPACGSREASKNKKHTYCYDCGTLAVTEIKRVAGKPGILEANIVWF